MQNFKEKEQYMIHAYKYNGWLYRTVEFPYVLYENETVICLYLPKEKINILKAKEINDQTNEKRFFFSKNTFPMLWFFFKDKWFNIITIFKEQEINYYINIASPCLIEEKAIKYYDFDLDIKINGLNKYKIVDENEYEQNSKRWHYPEAIKQKIRESVDEIIKMIQDNWFKDLYGDLEIDNLKQFIYDKFDDESIQL